MELRANSAHPELPWQVTEIDTAVVEQLWSMHDSDVQNSAEHSRWPPTIHPETRFRFAGKALGRSPLVMEMRRGEDRVDVYELRVFVVVDVPDLPEGPIFTSSSSE